MQNERGRQERREAGTVPASLLRDLGPLCCLGLRVPTNALTRWAPSGKRLWFCRQHCGHQMCSEMGSQRVQHSQAGPDSGLGQDRVPGFSPTSPGRDAMGRGMEGAHQIQALHPALPVLHARPTLTKSTSRGKDWSWWGWGGWKLTWNWPALVPGQQMFALEPGWSSLQAVGLATPSDDLLDQISLWLWAGPFTMGAVWPPRFLLPLPFHPLSPACRASRVGFSVPGTESSLSLGLAVCWAVQASS